MHNCLVFTWMWVKSTAEKITYRVLSSWLTSPRSLNIERNTLVSVTHRLLDTSYTKYGGIFQLPRLQLAVPQFNSILTITACSQLRPHRLGAPSHRRSSPPPGPAPFRCQSQVQVVTCASSGYKSTLIGFDNLLEWLTELRRTVYLPVN